MNIIDRLVIRRFHELLSRSPKFRRGMSWFGIRVIKFPTDLWRYQEIVFETKPDVIIEIGTKHGGTSLYLAHLLELIGKGRVITIDIRSDNIQAKHPRITFIKGSSIDRNTIDQVKQLISPNDKVMAILDADYEAGRFVSELAIYGSLVSKGFYFIVENKQQDEAQKILKAFLKENSFFEIDNRIGGLLVSASHGGYLIKR